MNEQQIRELDKNRTMTIEQVRYVLDYICNRLNNMWMMSYHQINT